METRAHARLKQLAAEFLLAAGCRAVGLEVRCPASRYRVDAAGYLDPLPKRPRPHTTPSDADPVPSPVLRRTDRPKTIIIECKQCRSDFLRDTRQTARLLAERDRLDRERQRIEEERIKSGEPHLRRSGTALFADMEEWEFSGSRLATYRRLIADLRRIDAQLYGQTKLWMISHYRLADLLLLAAPAGMITRRELPRGWGLLECPKRLLTRRRPASAAADEPTLHLTVDPPEWTARADRQQRMLRNIAVAATRDAFRRTVPATLPAPPVPPARGRAPARGAPPVADNPTLWIGM